MKFGCSIGIFFNSAHLICRSADVSKCFRGSLRLRDNESRLYMPALKIVKWRWPSICFLSFSISIYFRLCKFCNVFHRNCSNSFYFSMLHIMRSVRAAVSCAISERPSSFESFSKTTALMCVKLVTVSDCCSFIFISLWMSLALFAIS